MSRKLFLTSTGFNPDINIHFLSLVGKKMEDIIVAFIANASDPYDDKKFINYDKNVIRLMGMHLREIDLRVEDEDSLKLKFTSCDVIYVCGGNTFYLLDWTRKCGFDKVLTQMLDNGKVYVGVSAGSILVGPDIELAGWDPSWDENIAGLLDTTGMNIVPFTVSPHFVEGHRKLLDEKSKTVTYPIVAINDDQAVSCIDNSFTIVGNGQKIIFNAPT